MIWNRSQTSPHCLSSEQSQTPIPARAGLGALSIFLPWHLGAGWSAECGGGCPCLPSASQCQCGRGPGWGLREGPGVSAFPGPYTGKFPSHLPGPAFHFQHVGLAQPSKTTIVIGILAGPGSSTELLVSTNNPCVMITPGDASQLSIIST